MRPLEMSERRTILAKSIMVGAIAGSVSGLFGVGGGIIMAPGLVMLVGLGVRKAAASALATVVPIAAFGLIGYAVAGKVEPALALAVAAGALIGTAIGNRLLRVLPERALMAALGLLLIVVAIRMVQQVGAGVGPDSSTIETLEAAGIGMFAGFLSGLFGVGGGFVIVPALILLLGKQPAIAKGTSLMAMMPPAVLGTYLNARSGFVDWQAAAAGGVTGAGLAYLSAGVSVGLDPAVANVSFGLLLIVVASRLLWQARQMDRPNSEAGAEVAQSRG